MAIKPAQGRVTILDKATQPLRSIANAFKNLGVTSKKTNTNLSKTQKAINGVGAAQNQLNRVSKNMQNNTRGIGSQAVGVVALGLSFKAALMPAIEFESAFAGVAKVAEGTPKQMQSLSKELVKLTSVIPKTAVELASIAEAGAKMGFKTDSLIEFTTIVAKASTAFGITAEEAGSSLGKISSVLGLGMGDLELYGDRVNHLADSIEASSSGIIDITKRVAGAFSALNLGLGDVTGLSAFADQMAVTSELGASGLNQIINRMRATREGAVLFEKEGAGALVTMAEKFKKLDGFARSSAITKLFGTGEGSRMFEKMISQTDKLKLALRLGNEKKAIGSMGREFDVVSKTTENAMKLLNNSMNIILLTFGSKLAPALGSVARGLSEISTPISKFIDENSTLVRVIGYFAGALLTVKAVALLYTASLWLIAPAIMGVSKALGFAKLAMLALNFAMTANPIGLVVVGIAALITAGVYLYKYWADIKELFSDLWKTIKDFSFKHIMNGLSKVKELFGFGGDSKLYLENKTEINKERNNFLSTQSPEIQAQALAINNSNNGISNLTVNIADGKVKSIEKQGNLKFNTFLNNGEQN